MKREKTTSSIGTTVAKINTENDVPAIESPKWNWRSGRGIVEMFSAQREKMVVLI